MAASSGPAHADGVEEQLESAWVPVDREVLRATPVPQRQVEVGGPTAHRSCNRPGPHLGLDRGLGLRLELGCGLVLVSSESGSPPPPPPLPVLTPPRLR